MAIDPDHMEPLYEDVVCGECEWFEPCPCGCDWGICSDKLHDMFCEFVHKTDVICSVDVTYGRQA